MSFNFFPSGCFSIAEVNFKLCQKLQCKKIGKFVYLSIHWFNACFIQYFSNLKVGNLPHHHSQETQALDSYDKNISKMCNSYSSTFLHLASRSTSTPLTSCKDIALVYCTTVYTVCFENLKYKLNALFHIVYNTFPSLSFSSHNISYVNL